MGFLWTPGHGEKTLEGPDTGQLMLGAAFNGGPHSSMSCRVFQSAEWRGRASKSACTAGGTAGSTGALEDASAPTLQKEVFCGVKLNSKQGE